MRADPVGLPSTVMAERRFLIRTFGCQMNEHDSERIGGLLMADGMTPTEDPGEARVIVLNTCAIRENADNKLYGNLGHLKPLKDTRPDLRSSSPDVSRRRTRARSSARPRGSTSSSARTRCRTCSTC